MRLSGLCETVTGPDMAALLAARDAACRAAMVELRLDGVRDPDVASALAHRPAPVIVTCRVPRDGGRFTGEEADRLRLLIEAARLGAEYVDVEWEADRTGFAAAPCAMVLSHHDFSGIPADIHDRVRQMAAEPHEVIKIAVRVDTLADCVDLRDATRIAARRVVIGMGSGGAITRACPWLFGSAWTYAGAAAPGQISAEQLAGDFRFGSAGPATRVVALSGPDDRARATAIRMNALFAERDVDAVAVPVVATRPADRDAAVRLGLWKVIDVSDAGDDIDARAAREAAQV